MCVCVLMVCNAAVSRVKWPRGKYKAHITARRDKSFPSDRICLLINLPQTTQQEAANLPLPSSPMSYFPHYPFFQIVYRRLLILDIQDKTWKSVDIELRLIITDTQWTSDPIFLHSTFSSLSNKVSNHLIHIIWRLLWKECLLVFESRRKLCWSMKKWCFFCL